MKIRFKVSEQVSTKCKRIRAQVEALPPRAYMYFKKITPIDTGNARSRTRLTGNTIRANYDYAKRLDEGYSKQAPNGMTEPTKEFIAKELRKIMKGR